MPYSDDRYILRIKIVRCLTPGVIAADRRTAEKIKNDGNVLFKKGKFAAAVDLYTEAILHAPDMHVIYVNRAMSYLKLEKWEQCESDARCALSIQSGLIKVMFTHILEHKCYLYQLYGGRRTPHRPLDPTLHLHAVSGSTQLSSDRIGHTKYAVQCPPFSETA